MSRDVQKKRTRETGYKAKSAGNQSVSVEESLREAEFQIEQLTKLEEDFHSIIDLRDFLIDGRERILDLRSDMNLDPTDQRRQEAMNNLPFAVGALQSALDERLQARFTRLRNNLHEYGFNVDVFRLESSHLAGNISGEELSRELDALARKRNG